ncbi:phospholipase D-like domain-containing protein [Nocardioides jiangxiensis]|uniref:Phospholipase D-like domain-containing protein n=1 Tax=Nocardioides jiangxiensis TaxID=3064524 RepID=A0ABT9AXU3_9ACTN|nr:phospholipase D-like domain-containing protein [Nocardioides sp. WY-20]MDO7867387.1 phospholipase D-like domain-containing protein [Nocardioides sp. WY-20]
MKRLWIVLVPALLAPVVLAAATHEQAGPRPAVSPVAASLPRSQRTAAPSERLLHNDPHTDPHAIADALVDDIDGVPPGERIDITTYWLESGRIAEALVRAHRRGVVVHLRVDASSRSRTPEAHTVAAELARTPDDGSWLHRDRHVAGADEGILHEKTFRFSRTGADRWVVVTGSWNAADSSDRNTYAAMWRVAGHEDVYDAFAAAEAAEKERMRGPGPARWFRGQGWAAYFLPLSHHAVAADASIDPVMRILRAVPATRTTRVRVAMYSMWDTRAAWIAAELARISRGGGHVVMVAGPTVDAATRATLRAAGGQVVNGCFPDGTFVHSKDMALTYVHRGRTVRWTWVGSDNWTSRGMTSDQAVLGLEGAGPQRQFVAAFAPLARRTDGLDGRTCRPRHD